MIVAVIRSMKKFKFKLRTLLLATFVVAAVLAVYSERSLRQRKIVNQLLSNGGIAYYTVEDGTPFPQQFVASKSDFLRHFQYPIKMMVLQPSATEPTDQQLSLVSKLPRLDYLYVWPGGVKGFDNQPNSTSADGGMTDDGVNVLITKLSHLQHFGTTSATCSEDKLSELDIAMNRAELLFVLPHPNSNSKPLSRQ